MSFTLRALLIFFAVVVFYFVIRKLKNAQMQVLDSLFWLLFSISFVLLGIFPEIAVRIAGLLGFMLKDRHLQTTFSLSITITI